MFEKILIANRGEIALRILRACREMGIQTVAVHSTADEHAMHVRLADESVCIGGPSPTDSYLNIPNIIAACEITGAEAVHPGYGFLSENQKFAHIVEAHGISFIGPTAEHIGLMGDKITAKITAEKLGIPTVPGSDGEVMDLDFARSEAERIGFPLIIKAAAGGGGRGMKVVSDKKDLEEAFNTARREAQMAFGNGAVYMERYLQKPRHIEIQVIGDGLGSGLHLGERDCSLQRRHQKVLEEAPSVCLNNNQRDEIGAICAKAIGELKYRGVGTIEFLYEDGSFFFIEMNTRLQVEHPVTEAIFNIDLVKEQIRIAAGLGISFTQDELTMSGHAIECRINAEDPFNLTPSPGHVDGFHPAGGYGVRVDSALFSGYDVPPYYDSLIAKLIVHGKSRNECLLRLNRCLHEFVVSGISTNIALFDEILKDQDFQNGQYDIHWLTKFLEERGVRLS